MQQESYLAACHSLLTTHYSLLTTHCLVFTYSRHHSQGVIVPVNGLTDPVQLTAPVKDKSDLVTKCTSHSNPYP